MRLQSGTKPSSRTCRTGSGDGEGSPEIGLVAGAFLGWGEVRHHCEGDDGQPARAEALQPAATGQLVDRLGQAAAAIRRRTSPARSGRPGTTMVSVMVSAAATVAPVPRGRRAPQRGRGRRSAGRWDLPAAAFGWRRFSMGCTAAARAADRRRLSGPVASALARPRRRNRERGGCSTMAGRAPQDIPFDYGGGAIYAASAAW